MGAGLAGWEAGTIVRTHRFDGTLLLSCRHCDWSKAVSPRTKVDNRALLWQAIANGHVNECTAAKVGV